VNKTGFSPRQVTFGQQGVIPGIGDGNPASMEPAIESEAVRKLILYRQKAEEIYRRVDSNERIQKSLAQQTYGYQDSTYEPGDSVLFKEEGKDRWAGPAKVIGVEGNKVRVIHSGYDRTVPKCRVMPAEAKRAIINEEVEKDLIEEVTKEAINEIENEKSDKVGTVGTEKEVSIEESKPTEFDKHKLEVRPKRNQEIEYTVDRKTSAGKVIKVGKPNGKDRFRCCIKNKDGTTISLDFHEDVDSWRSIKKVAFEEDEENYNIKNNKIIENDHLGVYFLKNQDVIDGNMI
jgi:hypothetical protein